jgi:folate-binding protein YgfZ
MIEISSLHISGKDAFSFLQGQLTCNMSEITEKNHFGALCNPKGRVIASFEIQKIEDSFLIHLPKTMIPIVIKILEKYAQFSEVSLKEIDLKLPKKDLVVSIRNKIAVIIPETSGLFTPHELNYHELGFVSFNKGCYTGQEIIARMQYLGKLKKSLQYIKTPSPENISGEVVNIVKCDEINYEALALSTN